MKVRASVFVCFRLDGGVGVVLLLVEEEEEEEKGEEVGVWRVTMNENLLHVQRGDRISVTLLSRRGKVGG